MPDTFICGTVRFPVYRFNAGLAGVCSNDLAAAVVRAKVAAPPLAGVTEEE